jgi:hypothetical protein
MFFKQSNSLVGQAGRRLPSSLVRMGINQLALHCTGLNFLS